MFKAVDAMVKQLFNIVERGMRVAQPMCLILLNSQFVCYKIHKLYY